MGHLTRAPATSLPLKSKLAYAILGALLVGSVAFQFVLSADSLQLIWSQSQHFRREMITSFDLEFIGHVLTPFACLVLGFYVVGVRVFDGRAWLLLALLISFSVMANGADQNDQVMRWTTPLKHLALAYRSVLFYTFPFWLALFAIYFPDQADWERRHPRLKWLFLVPAALLSFWMAVLRIAANEMKSSRFDSLRNWQANTGRRFSICRSFSFWSSSR